MNNELEVGKNYTIEELLNMFSQQRKAVSAQRMAKGGKIVAT